MSPELERALAASKNSAGDQDQQILEYIRYKQRLAEEEAKKNKIITDTGAVAEGEEAPEIAARNKLIRDKEKNPGELPVEKKWSDNLLGKGLHHAAISQHVVLNPIYNALLDANAKTHYYMEDYVNPQMPGPSVPKRKWETLSPEEQNEYKKKFVNSRIQNANDQRDSAIVDYVKNKDKELTKRAIGEYEDDWAKRYPGIKEKPPVLSQEELYDYKNKVVNKLFGEKKELIKPTSDYEQSVDTLRGKINAQDFINLYGEDWLWALPEGQRKALLTAPTLAFDLFVDPLIAIGAIKNIGVKALSKAGLVNDTGVLKATRKIFEKGNLKTELDNLSPEGTILSGIRKDMQPAMRKLSDATGVPVEQLSDDVVKQFILDDAKKASQGIIPSAKRAVGEKAASWLDSLRKTPNANRSDAEAVGQRLKSIVPGTADMAERAFVYEGIGKQGIRKQVDAGNIVTKQEGRDVFNALRDVRGGRAVESLEAKDEIKRIVKGSTFENFDQLPKTRKDEINNALENYWAKDVNSRTAGTVGEESANFTDEGARISEEASRVAKTLGKDEPVFHALRKALDDETIKSGDDVILKSGEVVKGQLDKADRVINYVPHTHTDYSEKLTRSHQGTVREIEALNGKKAIAGKLVDDGVVSPDMVPALTLYSGGYGDKKLAQSLGYLDARTVAHDAPRLKDIAEAYDLREKGVDIGQFIDDYFPNAPKRTKQEYMDLLSDKKAVELMKETPYSFKEIDEKVIPMAKEKGVDIESAIKSKQYEYDRDVTFAAAKGIQRMRDRRNLLQSFADMDAKHPGTVVFVKKGAKKEDIPKGLVKFSDNTYVNFMGNVKEKGQPLLLSTSHDIYMRPEFLDMLNNYKRNFTMDGDSAFSSVVNGLMRGMGEIKSGLTTFKATVGSFIGANVGSSAIQTAAILKPSEYTPSIAAALNSLGKGDGVITTPLGKFTTKKMLELARRKGALSVDEVVSNKVVKKLKDDMKTSSPLDLPGTLRNVGKMEKSDIASELGKGAVRQLIPSESTITKTARGASERVENVNRMAAMIAFVKRGYTPEIAADMVKALYVDYNASAPGIKFLSKTFIPFIQFTRQMLKRAPQEFIPGKSTLGKANFMMEGQSVEKPSSGVQIDEVMKQTPRGPMSKFISKNTTQDPSRYLMPSPVLGMDPSGEFNTGLSSVVTTGRTLATGKKSIPGSPLPMSVDDRDVELLGTTYKANRKDKILGMPPQRFSEGINVFPHVQMVRQIAQFLPKSKDSMYDKQRPLIELFVSKNKDVNAGYSLMIQKGNYIQEKNKELEMSTDKLAGKKGYGAVLADKIGLAYKPTGDGYELQPDKVDIETYRAVAKMSGAERNKLIKQMEDSMSEATKNSSDMIALSKAVLDRLEAKRKTANKSEEPALLKRIERASESIVANKNTIEKIYKKYIPMYLYLKSRK